MIMIKRNISVATGYGNTFLVLFLTKFEIAFARICARCFVVSNLVGVFSFCIIENPIRTYLDNN